LSKGKSSSDRANCYNDGFSYPGCHVSLTEPPINRCPSCRKAFDPDTTICVGCGIDINTGRSLITSEAVDVSHLKEKVRDILDVVSWFAPIGMYPVASEARGGEKPIAAWSIAITTAVLSVAFWFTWITDDPTGKWSQAMLWTGNNGYDDKFHWYQLITHAFLHADIVHLAGNMLFLLILGNKVNSLVGSIVCASSYFLLAIVAGLAEFTSAWSSEVTPMLGASGAVMGMAGMYIVLFPTQRVYMTAWIRPLILLNKTFAVRGYVVVLFYIAFDVIYVVMSWEDNVAHWAHLGGFIGGVLLGLGLILGRQINAHGSDILSVIWGPLAWKWIGTPLERRKICSFLSQLP